MSETASIPIVNTEVFEKMHWIFEYVTRTASIAVVQGSPSVGKTFAIRSFQKTAEAADVRVTVATSSPEIEGSIVQFANSILRPFGMREGNGAIAMEAVTQLVSGRPFSEFLAQPSIFIVDEAQSLKSNVLGALRGIWDDRDAARLGEREAPAFGMVLCPNHDFLSRGGKLRKAEFGPLLSRISIHMELKPPTEPDCLKFAELLTDDQKLQALLSQFGAKNQSLRAVEKLWETASDLAGDTPLTKIHIQTVLQMRGDT